MPTWDADQYLRFEAERRRPCLDLAARVALMSARRAIDLGCGPGNSTAVVADFWPDAELTGLDDSPEMIAAAEASPVAATWQLGDIAAWAGDPAGGAYDLVFSNASLQWVPDHAALFPKLLRRVAPGGALAVEMPANLDAPAHEAMRRLARSDRWRDAFPPAGVREWHTLPPADYYDLLAPQAATVDVWVTEYVHVLPDAESVVEWYRGTGLRPFLAALADDAARARFGDDFLSEVRRAYPPRADGRVLFPFRRLFVIASRPLS